MLPFNAQPIADARINGFKPADLVIVSMVGRLRDQNPTVYASAGKRYEWGFLRGLQVCVFSAEGIPVAQTLEDIAKAKPATLWLWDVNRKEGAEVRLFPRVEDIEKPADQWRWQLSFIELTPFQNQDFEYEPIVPKLSPRKAVREPACV